MSEQQNGAAFEVPIVKVLDAIRPENAGTGELTLYYTDLGPAVEYYAQSERQRTDAFWDQQPDSLDEEFKGRQLAFQYLLQTAHRAIVAPTPQLHDLWADRYTQASIELYGAPDPTEAAAILSDEYQLLKDNQNNPHVSRPEYELLTKTYEKIAATLPAGAIERTHEASEHEKLAIAAYGLAMRDQYQPIFDLVDQNKPAYKPTELRDLFTQAVTWMTDNVDPGWTDWHVEIVPGTNMSVSPKNRLIRVGERRAEASPQTATKLLAHELLVHALRGQNGFSAGDSKLGTGLANFVTAEEGLGKVAEQAVTGEIPESSRRYLDIALALGTIDGVQHSRHELLNLSRARKIVFEQIEQGTYDVDFDHLTRTAISGVDRIYRGGRGDDFGQRSAIFTNDLAYFKGYKQMANYITEQIQAGHSAKDILAFLSQGAFDPTNPKHLVYLAQATKVS